MDQVEFGKLCDELTKILEGAYEACVTIDEAERLAARFLHAQILTAQLLAEQDLDSRMRKIGVKAIRAAIYMENATKGDKKPSDVMLEAIVNKDEIVQGEQTAYDLAEVQRDRTQNYFNIFKESHIYFRGVAKGRFE